MSRADFTQPELAEADVGAMSRTVAPEGERNMYSQPSYSTIWEPTIATRNEPARPVKKGWSLVTLESEILGVLEAPVPSHETISVAFTRVERELVESFGRLSLLEARELLRRLKTPAADDAIAARFGRLVVERRLRLLAYLADAPRREALRPQLRSAR